MADKIFSISEYLNFLNIEFKKYKAKITGEVSKVDFSSTGNVYFYLKDERDQSTLKCMIFKNKYDLYNIKLEEGVKIIAEGYPNLHKSYSFAFIAEVIEYSGEGNLRKEYERLKKKLTEEGIFAEERKRPIPSYLQKIGIITSLTGAVIADFSNNLGDFGFRVKIVNSRVDGQVAVADLLSSIKLFRKQDIEVLIIMRGGGSLESMMPLMPFNNELLIREVVNFPVPVLAAIGHHKDVPLIAFAADLNVSTPSIAATTLNESWKQAILFLERYEKNIINLYSKQLSKNKDLLDEFIRKVKEQFGEILNKYKEAESNFKIFLSRIKDALTVKQGDINNIARFIFRKFSTSLSSLNSEIESVDPYSYFDKALMAREKNINDCLRVISRNFISELKNYKYQITNVEKLILSYNPERQLKLGYSIARHNGKIIKTVKNVKIGEDMEVQVFDGSIQSKIKNIK